MAEMMNEVKFPPKIRKVNIFNVNVKRRDIRLSHEIQAPRFLGTPHNRTVHRSVPLFALTAQDSPRSSPLKDIKEECFPRPSQHSPRRADEHECFTGGSCPRDVQFSCSRTTKLCTPLDTA